VVAEQEPAELLDWELVRQILVVEEMPHLEITLAGLELLT
jgi:hypothetical protein